MFTKIIIREPNVDMIVANITNTNGSIIGASPPPGLSALAPAA
jgi:hypothetical protein